MNNQQIIQDGMARAQRIIDNRIMAALYETMWDLTDATKVPVWTHNLWDSIGCGIYKDGTLQQVAYPPAVATEPRTHIYGVLGIDPNDEFLGREQLQDMITNPPAEILTSVGWCLYYVAAQPYAQKIDARSNADVLHEELAQPSFLSHIRTV